MNNSQIWRAVFRGRLKGAIGAVYTNIREIEVWESIAGVYTIEEYVRLRLYDSFDHISALKLNRVK